MIIIVHWLKCIIIEQKLTLVVEFEPFCLPIGRHCSCDVMYVVMCTLGQNNYAAKRYSMCEQARG